MLLLYYSKTDPSRQTSHFGKTLAMQYNRISTAAWTIKLPAVWKQQNTDDSVYFEAEDHSKGIYLRDSEVTLEKPGMDNPAVAAAMIVAARSALEKMEGYQWHTLLDKADSESGYASHLLDVHDPRKTYRITTKILVKLPYVLKINLHDYACADVFKSQVESQLILQSLTLLR